MPNKVRPHVLVHGRTSGGTNFPIQVDATGVVQTNGSGGGGGGGAATIADGADVNAGATTDAAVTGNNTGTLSAKLRGLSKILADVWDSTNHWLKVSIQNPTITTVNGIGLPAYDYVTYTSGSTTDTYVFKVGGSGGSTAATVTLTYTDSTKAVLSTVAKT